jgi:hypothetical protein
VFRLLEALGETQQAQLASLSSGQVIGRPLLLQALPYLKNLTCLMNYPLGKVVLEALTAGVFWLGHILTTS